MYFSFITNCHNSIQLPHFLQLNVQTVSALSGFKVMTYLSPAPSRIWQMQKDSRDRSRLRETSSWMRLAAATAKSMNQTIINHRVCVLIKLLKIKQTTQPEYLLKYFGIVSNVVILSSSCLLFLTCCCQFSAGWRQKEAGGSYQSAWGGVGGRTPQHWDGQWPPEEKHTAGTDTQYVMLSVVAHIFTFLITVELTGRSVCVWGWCAFLVSVINI